MKNIRIFYLKIYRFWKWNFLYIWIGVFFCNAAFSFIRTVLVTSYIWHSTDVRAEWPLFSAPPGIWLAYLFFNKKYMNDPIFLDSYVKGPTFLTSWYMHIFFTQRFFEVASFVGIQCIDADICLITSNKWVQKIKGQYMNRSTFRMIKYMNGSVFFKGQVYEWGRFWNTGSHTRTTITPKLPSPPPFSPENTQSPCVVLLVIKLLCCTQQHNVQKHK